MNDADDEYLRLAAWVCHAARQAEAHGEEANRLIRAEVTAGCLHPGVIVGPAVLQCNYHPDANRDDSALVARLVLHAPRGLGVAWWDIDVRYERVQEEGFWRRTLSAGSSRLPSTWRLSRPRVCGTSPACCWRCGIA